MRTTLWLLMELGAFSRWYGRTSLPHHSRPSPRRHRRHPSTQWPYHGNYAMHRSHQEVIIPSFPSAFIHPPATHDGAFFFLRKATVAFTSFKVVLIVLSRWTLYRGFLRHLHIPHQTTVAGHPPHLHPPNGRSPYSWTHVGRTSLEYVL